MCSPHCDCIVPDAGQIMFCLENKDVHILSRNDGFVCAPGTALFDEVGDSSQEYHKQTCDVLICSVSHRDT